MTTTQRTQLERATAIASRDGLEVAGKGKTKDGRTVYAVPSRSQAGRWHLVAVISGAHLVCDCQAAQYGRICAHRAATRERLAAEAEAKRLARLEAADSDRWALVEAGQW